MAGRSSEEARSLTRAMHSVEASRAMALAQNNAWYEVLLHQGRNQQVRRMFELIGHSVMKLRRVRIGFLTDEHLKPGGWRFLSPAVGIRLNTRASPWALPAQATPARS